ncbi:triose-phosphate isomerase [Gammaproteobacteria bacterium 42_54_T18]|nr:triose-phosphate isomerase [Gammaproteobacteria bacterium 42_54_T18]
MRKAMVAGNWKMNGSKASVAMLVEEFVALRKAGAAGHHGRVDAVLFPTELFVDSVLSMLPQESGVTVGAQNASHEVSGAHTGEVSPVMLKDAGCRYVILGHSERRALYQETDSVVADKFKAAQAAGLVPVLCVGESQQERESGHTVAVVERQLSAVVARCGITALSKSVLAYEPVWAIGTGLTATPEQAQDIHASIRAWIERQDAVVAGGLQILYGGSVKSSNAHALFACDDIDGGLIGGASLDAKEFAAICSAAG